jgi:predicted Mrr-cat superfamily restriction endonuclease
MDSKELVNDYNQHFLTLLKQIQRAYKIVEYVSIEFYTSSFPMSIAMFIKNVEKSTLEESFQESLKVEKNMLSLKGNPGVESSKDNVKSKEAMYKPSKDKKNYDSMDMETLQRIVKKISNELIDLKKNGAEGSSSSKNFFRFPPNKDKSTLPTKKKSFPGGWN